MRRILMLFCLLLIPTLTQAKEEAPKSPSPDSMGIEALQAYPKDIRQATLEVALHHNLLVEVSQIQQQAADTLKKLLQNQPRKFQNQVYQLVRFPKLVNELAAGGPKSAKQVRALLKPYPKEIHKLAFNLARNHFALLEKINNTNDAANKKFTKLIQSYPEKTKQAYLKILQHPVILHILTKNLNYTHQLAQAYQTQSAEAKQRLKQVESSAQKKDEIIRATRQGEAARDPQAEALKSASEKFVKQANLGLDQVLDPKKAVQVNVTYDPYFNSYWNAAPGFYDYPYWYGFPDWGYDGWW